MRDKGKKSYLCHKINAMKKHFLAFFGLVLLLIACTQKPDTLIGDWVADKVNVQFDENHATPELVKQIGEIEKQNRISISSDSTLVFKTLDSESQGHITVDEQGVVYCDGKKFGLWKDGMIVTTTSSPLGAITVKYRKE